MSRRRRSIVPLILNLADGTFYRPSFPAGWTPAAALASMAAGVSTFYFREVRRVRRRILPDYWEDTGAIWQPESGEFKVLTSPELIEKAMAP